MSGPTNINSNTVVVVRPISLNAAYVKVAVSDAAAYPDEYATNIFFLSI